MRVRSPEEVAAAITPTPEEGMLPVDWDHEWFDWDKVIALEREHRGASMSCQDRSDGRHQQNGTAPPDGI